MKRVLAIIVFVMLGVFVMSCNDNISVPQNLKIDDSIITFDLSNGATKYRVQLVNAEDGSIIKRFVSSGDDLNDYNIPEGTYNVSIQAISKNNQESEYSEPISYNQIDLNAVQSISEDKLIDGEYIKWMGRTYYNQTKKVNEIYYSAAGFEVKVKEYKPGVNVSVKATVTATNYSQTTLRPYVVLVMDNDFDNSITLSLTKAENEIVMVGEGGFTIDDSNEHVIALYKRSESIDSHIALKSLETTGKFVSGISYKDRRIEVIAASSSTGYGNLSSDTKTTATSDALKAFAFLTAQALGSELNIVSASGWGISSSMWTSPHTKNMATQYKYVDCESNVLWDTTKYVPDCIITNFGTNDSSYINQNGITALEKQTRQQNFINTYVDFLKYLHATYPNAQIIVLYGLMNETTIYTDTETIYNTAKVDIPNLEIIKINGDAKGNNSHPSVASHAQIASTLTSKIKDCMGW